MAMTPEQVEIDTLRQHKKGLQQRVYALEKKVSEDANTLGKLRTEIARLEEAVVVTKIENLRVERILRNLRNGLSTLQDIRQPGAITSIGTWNRVEDDLADSIKEAEALLRGE